MNSIDTTKLIRMRRMLHAHPELSGHEWETQGRIKQFLNTETHAQCIDVAGTGLLAVFDSGKEGPVVLIRGDIDALPIEEINDFEHRSVYEGVSHKCGHDGHTTILLGLAMQLSARPLPKGKALLLFQPAEENGMGAEAVLRDPAFPAGEIDYVFALHNLPGFEKQMVVVKEGAFTAHVQSAIICLKGKTSHAAEPEHGINPAPAIAALLQYAQQHTHNEPAADDFFLLTPVYATLGEKAYGISAGYGEVHLTLRSWSSELMKEKSDALHAFVKQLAAAHGLKYELSWTQVFHANHNHPGAVAKVRQAAQTAGLQLMQAAVPFKWGEDFGLFTRRYKGAMFGLGAGKETPALHNPDYDFPDELIPAGVAVFEQIVRQTVGL